MSRVRTRPTRDETREKLFEAAAEVFEEHGIGATVRLTRGQDIDAACGQLAAKALASASSACPRCRPR